MLSAENWAQKSENQKGCVPKWWEVWRTPHWRMSRLWRVRNYGAASVFNFEICRAAPVNGLDLITLVCASLHYFYPSQ